MKLSLFNGLFALELFKPEQSNKAILKRTNKQAKCFCCDNIIMPNVLKYVKNKKSICINCRGSE